MSVANLPTDQETLQSATEDYTPYSVTKAQGGFITEYKQTLSDFGRNVSKEFPKGTNAVTIAADSVVVNNELSTTLFVEISIRRNKRRSDALAPLSAKKSLIWKIFDH